MDESTLAENSDTSSNSQAHNRLSIYGSIDPGQPYTDLQFSNGHVICVPTQVLVSAPTQSSFPPARGTSEAGESADVLVPVIEESLTVDKRTVATGKVILRKSVQAFEQQLDEMLAVRTFGVERVTLDQVVDAVPDVRQEGSTTIYPVVEERLVVTKELVLKEEIRITQQDTARRDTQTVTLHREQIVVERAAVGQDQTGQ